MRVLSIDFDYFVEADIDYMVRRFPDGGAELGGAALLDIVWQSCYSGAAVGGEPIDENVALYTEGFQKVLAFLKGQRNAKWFVADSHKHAYDFIRQFCNQPMRKASVVNIDFHHDTFPVDSKKVHCGNWLKVLLNQRKVQGAYWVKRPDSNTEGQDSRVKIMELAEVLQGQYDLIFICRSGWWSPPHLDSYFIEMANIAMNSGKRCEYQPSVMESRYTEDFRNGVLQLWEMREALGGKYHGR